MRQITNVHAVCAFASIGGGLFGYDIASMSGVLGTPAYTHFFDHPKGAVQGLITCCMPFGSIFGALITSLVADRFSRKVAIQFASVLWILGSAVQAACNGLPMLCVGRAISGLGVGIASTIVPVYQAEIAPREIRGRMIALQQWAITWGILIQYFVQYGASFIDGGTTNDHQSTAAFRLPWALQAVPAFVLSLGLFWMPHSPRWLGSQDRWEEAIQVLADLHAKGDIHHPKVLSQYREIEEVLSFEKEVGAAGWAALLEPGMFKRVVLGMSVQMWSELCGMNVMMYYIVYIMESAQMASPLLTASVQYIINWAMTIPAFLSIDHLGRRPLLLWGAGGMACFLYISGILQAFYGEPVRDNPDSAITWVIRDRPSVSAAIVACSYLFVALFAGTWGPISWTYSAEIFPTKVRAKAVSLSTAANWTANSALAFAVPPLLYAINWRMYLIFGAFCTVACVHMFLAAPETKHVALEEMDRVFEGRRPWSRRGRRDTAPSALAELEQRIAEGTLKVDMPQPRPPDDPNAPIRVDTVIELTAGPRESVDTRTTSGGVTKSIAEAV